MKIVVCGSMTSAKKMVEIKKSIEEKHEVTLPEFTEKFSKLDDQNKIDGESIKDKINHDLIRNYFNKIKDSDAILVVNEEKNGIKNYIGGNTFLEIGFAHVLNKKIFLINPIPEVSYKDEIIAMQPKILNNLNFDF